MDVGNGNDNVLVVIYSLKGKVVTLNKALILADACPELRHNIVALGHSLIATWNGDKDITILLL